MDQARPADILEGLFDPLEQPEVSLFFERVHLRASTQRASTGSPTGASTGSPTGSPTGASTGSPTVVRQRAPAPMQVDIENLRRIPLYGLTNSPLFKARVLRIHEILSSFDKFNSTPESRDELFQTIKREMGEKNSNDANASPLPLEAFEALGLIERRPVEVERPLPSKPPNVSPYVYQETLRYSDTFWYASRHPLIAEDSSCVICSLEFVDTCVSILVECHHVFHFECLLTWFEQKESVNQVCTCPMCREQYF